MSTQLLTCAASTVGTSIQLLETLTEGYAGNVSVRFWDESSWSSRPDLPARFILVLRHPGALRQMLWPFSAVAFGEAYIFDDFDIEGDIEANNLNGRVTLKNVSGTVNAHSLNGEVTAVLDSVDPSKPLSFSTMNGDIDVTLPSDLKAKVHRAHREAKALAAASVTMVHTVHKAPWANEGVEANVASKALSCVIRSPGIPR